MSAVRSQGSVDANGRSGGTLSQSLLATRLAGPQTPNGFGAIQPSYRPELYNPLLHGNAAIGKVMGSGRVAFERGVDLIRQGESDGSVFRLHSGWIGLTRDEPGYAAPRIVGLVLPGDLIGLEALLGRKARVGAVCLTHVSAHVADRTTLRASAHGNVALYLMWQITEQQRRSEALAARFSSQKVRDRVAAALDDVFVRLRRIGSASNGAFLLPLTRTQFAAYVAADPEAVDDAVVQLQDLRTLSAFLWQPNGIVVSVADPSNLATLSGSSPSAERKAVGQVPADVLRVEE